MALTGEYSERRRKCVGIFYTNWLEGDPAIEDLGLRCLRIAISLMPVVAMVEASEYVEGFSMETLTVTEVRVFSCKDIAPAFPASTIKCCNQP